MKQFSFFILVLFSFSCKSQQVSTGTKADDPNAPQETYKTVMNQKYLSTINIPFDINMVDVEKQINANIQTLIYEDNSMEDNNYDNMMMKVWKKSNFTVVAQQDNIFNITAPLKIWVKMGYKTILGTIPPQEITFEVALKFTTKFSIDPTWEANTQTTLTGYDWITKPSLTFGSFTIPITPVVEKALDTKKEFLSKQIDDGVRKNVEIKKYIIQAWNTAMQPTLLSQKYRTWLKVSPQELFMTPLKTVNNRVIASIGLKAFTETTTGEKPIIQPVTTVPNLQIVTQIPENFQIGIISEISFAEAAKLTADTIVGQSFTFKDGKYKVEVTDIDVYGNEGQLIIKAGLQGSMKGNIYFKGVPTYNPKDTTIYLENFDYDLKTKNILLKVGSWLFAGKLAKTMKEALTFKIADKLAETRKQIQSSLSANKVAKGVIINGKIEELTPDKVYLSPNGIVAVTFAKGKMNLQVDGL